MEDLNANEDFFKSYSDNPLKSLFIIERDYNLFKKSIDLIYLNIKDDSKKLDEILGGNFKFINTKAPIFHM